MNFWAVENSKLVLYSRVGQCNKCGECCCTHTITYQMEVGFMSGKRDDEGKDNYDWSGREGWSMFIGQGIWWYFKVVSIEERKPEDAICKRFVNGLCNIWQQDDFRPICRYWPFHPSDVEKFPGCGFRFERIEESG